MVPGWSQCPNNWNKEYSGWLVSASYSTTHADTQHICLDSRPNLYPGPEANITLTLSTIIPGQCPSGSKLCRDYQPERDAALPCVVCSSS